jgi:hypothetical protein
MIESSIVLVMHVGTEINNRSMQALKTQRSATSPARP